ncbi:MAG: hypothetical protein IT200_06220 [Thermoleophilia bacterium]|nr:hypothetical protein [Thermoleophilia bacterium]
MARRAAAWLALTAALLGIAAGPAAAARPRVTVFGDSVQASFLFTPRAVEHLRPGIDLRMQAEVCRRLSAAGCFGGSPPSVLTVANALGPALGDVVVVHVGYNDSASGYDIDAVMRAFTRAGVRAVVWVTLREARSGYATTNARIRAMVRRARRTPGGPVVRIADWNAQSTGRPWFVADRIHLNAAGAMGLSGLLRERVVRVLGDLGTVLPGPPATVTPVAFPARGAVAVAGDGGTLWRQTPAGLAAIDPGTGRPAGAAVRLQPSETLTADGVQAWIADAVRATVARARRRASGRGAAPAAGVGMTPLLARAGGWLWAVSTCPAGELVCQGAQVLSRIDPRTGRGSAVEEMAAPVRAVAADASALWVATSGAGGGPVLQQRDPVTGRTVRTVPLPGAVRSLAAAPDGAWAATGDGTLLRADRAGRVAAVGRSVRAVATAGAEVWVLRRNARTIEQLVPRTGRVRLRAVARRHVTGAITFTPGYVWLLSAGGGEILRIPRD